MRQPPFLRACAFALAAAATLAAGCAALAPGPVDRQPRGALAECARYLARVDAAVDAAGVADGMSARVAGFSHLRASRFLASYANEALEPAALADWIARLARLGAEAHAVEVANLPAAARDALAVEAARLLGEPGATAAVHSCSGKLAAADAATPERVAALRSAVRVPDDYVTWQRIVGLYWVTRIPFSVGVREWQEGTREVFERPVFMLPVRGERVRYMPPPGRPADVAAVLARASGNPLRIPDPRGEDRDALFDLYAPEFMVDAVGEADRAGAPVWAGGARPHLDTSRPTVYRRVSHARYRGRALLQLNYAIWFPERPLTSGWDLLGGHLDGLLWRVTLTPEGEPWVYDVMHLCGCYHEFFPTARAKPRAPPATLDEWAFMPQGELPALPAGARLSLRIESGTHYLQRAVIGAAVSAARHVQYRFGDDDELRSLPAAAGRRSLFRPDGIVPGTERGERYLFWPMGVPEPGAMRQWGRHATAFVGRRHFDAPGLMERYFEMREP